MALSGNDLDTTVYFRQEHVHASGRNLLHTTDADRLALGVTILADTVQAPLDLE